jgi:hypothetical protein
MDDTTRAYIAGFLDGDGSIIFQLVRRKDYALGFQVRSSVCFYQKTSGKAVLLWLKERLRVGYLRERGGMTDYAIVGHENVRRLLELVGPFVVAKREQVRTGLQLLDSLPSKHSALAFVALAERVDKYAALNYSKRKTVTADVVRRFFRDNQVS